MEMIRICSKCSQEKPLTIEYFQKSSRNKFGFLCVCKDCSKKRDNEYYDKNKIKALEYKKQWHIDNKSKVDESKRKWRENNKEKSLAIHKKYRETHKEENKIVHNKYKETHKEVYNINEQKRRAKRNLLECSLTKEQWENTKKQFDNKCCYCGKKSPLAMEHFVALSKGGEYTSNNIIPCCKSCNSSKSNKDFFEWYPKHESYSKSREIKILKYLNYKNKIQQLALII